MIHMKGRKPAPAHDPTGGAAGKRALAPVLACLFALSACHPGLLAIGGVVESADYMETRKTLPDRILSNVFDKDCSFSYFGEINRLCKDPQEIQEAPIYCYRTLGKVECYNAPNPYDSRVQPVGGMAQQKRQKLLYEEYLEKTWPRFREAPETSPRFLDEEVEPAPNLPPEGADQG